ncbi:Translin [Martensiomyces pterosporus]|nr:Translin [Martensiomyces pterosporus]
MSDEQRNNKRPRFNKGGSDDAKRGPKPSASDEPLSETKRAILQNFTNYRDTLDAHYDQRERIIKCSRDITALSKKIVFSLLRITQDTPEKVFKDAEFKHAQVLELFRKVSVELQGSNAYKYNRQVTPGLQEYIEAIGLWTFLQHDALITKEQVLDKLSVEGADGQRRPLVEVTDVDYILGISDLPGEVNRYCINSIGKGDHEAVERCLVFLRNLKEGINLLMCSGRIKDLDKKVPVLDSSLEKTEKAYYSMSIRETEMAKIGHTAVEAAEPAA